MRNQTRRSALKTIGATCGAFSLPVPGRLFANQDSNKPIRLGVIADLHGGLAVDAETRLDAFLTTMKGIETDALIQMGDFAFPNKKHQSFADKFNAAHDNTIHVIGNHEFDFGLTREDCFKAWGIKSAYYCRDVQGIRLIVLDGNETGSPTQKGYPSFIGKQQIAWLESELVAADRPLLILSHQPLAGEYAVQNADKIQELLTRHREKILLCINGHTHVDSLLQVDGVNYLHINSASYNWVGGETRMAYYEDPLFTTITINSEKLLVRVEAKISTWKGTSPTDIGYFDRSDAPPETIVVPAIRGRQLNVRENKIQTTPIARESTKTNLRVMTWNIWGRLNQEPRYTIDNKTARQRTIEIIRDSGADIVAMIETYGSATDIAAALGFHHYTPAADANLCIFSRYPLTDIEPLKELSAFSFIAATVNLPGGQKVRVYDIWLTSGGRHIVEIKNEKLTDKDFCDGDDLRAEQLQTFLTHDDFKKHVANSVEVPVIVAGDFNCVSHLDHNEGTRQSNLNQARTLPIKVSKAMHKAGFSDTYRQSNPDILDSTLGHTWTTVGMGFQYVAEKGFVPVKENPEPKYRDPYARIDYIYSIGSRLEPQTSTVIAHHPSQSERSFPEFPSDHAAVLTEFRILEK
ncbi:MAG: endonuclease/exonuclease/phosphatase family protein [Mariniblastus sp.]